jgi:hypothetical protein
MAERPPFEPTDEQRKLVHDMAAYGIPWEDIAKLRSSVTTWQPTSTRLSRSADYVIYNLRAIWARCKSAFVRDGNQVCGMEFH